MARSRRSAGQVAAVASTTENPGTDLGTAIKGMLQTRAGLSVGQSGPAIRTVPLSRRSWRSRAVDESRKVPTDGGPGVLAATRGRAAPLTTAEPRSADDVDELIATIAKRRRQAETPVVEKLRFGGLNDRPAWLFWCCSLAAYQRSGSCADAEMAAERGAG